MQEYIKVSLENGVGTITLNRAEKRNALRREFIEQVNGALHKLAGDSSLRVLILKAEGLVFCAGMDLGQMKERAASPNGAAELQKDSEVYCQLLTTIFQLDVPTVAILNGPALAGGVGLVLACDLVIASENTFFMLPEPMRGITAAMVTPLLIHRVGSGAATYMLLSGERVAADKALAIGLCHDVVASEQLEVRTSELIQSILTGSPAALAITKQHVHNCSSEVVELVKSSIEISARARETDEAQEGLAAFLENRKPNWQPAE